MRFSLTDDVARKYTGVVVAVLTFRGVNNRGSFGEIADLLRAVEAQVCSSLSRETCKEHPHIACWREAYRTFGAKPKEHLSSIENLVKRVLSGELIRHINPLVDLYNYVSLKYLVPVGGEDLGEVEGDIVLTLATALETPVLLLGEKEARPPHPGEVVYKDAKGILCRRWNWKEAERTKLTEETQDAVLVIEALPPVSREVVTQAAQELADLVQKYCGGNGKIALLDGDKRECDLR